MSNTEISQAERLDQYVTGQLETVSRAFASKLIERGDVLVNGEAEHKAGFKVRPGDTITINYDVTKEVIIPEIELEVIYEDKDCVVINKPVGVLSHSKGDFNPEGTVASWLRTRLKSMEGERAGIVHRLDRATSGVMICAKNPDAMAWLQKQFSQRKVKKTYVAVVKGVFKQRQAIIDMPIERNPKKPQTFRVGSNGKAAQTEYWVLKTNDKYSMVELKPTTGRTHQLRVHLENLGHPIVGDAFYNGPKADRLFLHAHELELTLPNRERKTFSVPVPKEFEELVQE
ncbi:MAG: Pseudouridine synthase [Candidatus Saccharibacteria bacterium]|jgi:23S rRNA pseudouridine1911/1915/1917 synthase|nr:Pseudouridine synthase [Candidatus Saccharibacteria bacterium]